MTISVLGCKTEREANSIATSLIENSIGNSLGMRKSSFDAYVNVKLRNIAQRYYVMPIYEGGYTKEQFVKTLREYIENNPCASIFDVVYIQMQLYFIDGQVGQNGIISEWITRNFSNMESHVMKARKLNFKDSSAKEDDELY